MSGLSRSEAEDLTKRLSSKSEQLAILITKAHDEQVWVPLGYNSFTQWADRELPFTYARAFQLLNIGVLSKQLQDVMALPEDFMLTDKQSRTISSNGRKLIIEALAEEATEDPSTNISKIRAYLHELEAAPRGDDEKPAERATLEKETNRIAGGNPITYVQNVHSLSAHLEEFPSPRNLDSRTREQGLTILLEAQATVQKHLDDAKDRNRKYEAHKANKS